jgi:hypothetical protein
MMEEKKVDNSRGLFNIIAINLDTDEIVYNSLIIAEGENKALFESDLKDDLKKLKLTLDDVHVIVKEIASVPARTKPRKFTIKGKLGKHILAREED